MKTFLAGHVVYLRAFVMKAENLEYEFGQRFCAYTLKEQFFFVVNLLHANLSFHL